MRSLGKLLLLLMLASVAVAAQQQTAAVRIHVVHDDMPVAGASVIINGAPCCATFSRMWRISFIAEIFLS